MDHAQGQLNDLYYIFSHNEFPNEKNPYLFNGDFVDRGDVRIPHALLFSLWTCASRLDGLLASLLAPPAPPSFVSAIGALLLLVGTWLTLAFAIS